MSVSSRARDALLGFAVGDAFAVTVDGLSPTAITERHRFVRRMLGGGRHDLPPGAGTALTALAVMGMTRLVDDGDFDRHRLVRDLVQMAANPPPGFPPGWGARLASGEGIGVDRSGHGFALSLPLAMRCGVSGDEARAQVTALLRGLDAGVELLPHHRWVARLRGEAPERDEAATLRWDRRTAATGLARDSLELASEAVARSSTFGETLMRLAARGGLCGAATAMAGALAALRWGGDAIPKSWLDLLVVRPRIDELSALL